MVTVIVVAAPLSGDTTLMSANVNVEYGLAYAHGKLTMPAWSETMTGGVCSVLRVHVLAAVEVSSMDVEPAGSVIAGEVKPGSTSVDPAAIGTCVALITTST